MLGILIVRKTRWSGKKARSGLHSIGWRFCCRRMETLVTNCKMSYHVISLWIDCALTWYLWSLTNWYGNLVQHYCQYRKFNYVLPSLGISQSECSTTVHHYVMMDWKGSKNVIYQMLCWIVYIISQLDLIMHNVIKCGPKHTCRLYF